MTPVNEGPEFVWVRVPCEEAEDLPHRGIRSDDAWSQETFSIESIRNAVRSALAGRLASEPREAVPIAEFGRIYCYSERTIYNFIDLGLPCIGAGRLRRIPLKEGGQWLRDHLADVATNPIDVAVEADLRGRKGT